VSVQVVAQPSLPHPLEKLYAVVTMGPDFSQNKRTVCLATSLQRARQVVGENIFDIHEGSYCYALIEGLEADAMYGGDPSSREWYQWEAGHYVHIAEPERFRRSAGGFWQ